MYNDYGQFINGSWRQGSSGETIVVTDPGRDERLGEIAAASREDTLEAIASAEAALAPWQARTAWERADMLHRVAVEMEQARERAGAVKFLTRQ